MKRINELKKDFSPAEAIEFVKSGEEFFSVLIDLINRAASHIHFQTYIFSEDDTGRMIAGALMKATRRGVKVFLLTDSFGSGGLNSSFIDELKAAGIQVRFFSPLVSSRGFQLGRRLHHKVVVVDGRAVLTGGINIDDKYRGTVNYRAWLDFAVLIKGNVCNQFDELCDRIWHKNLRRNRRSFLTKKENSENRETTQFLINMKQNDWLRKKNEISRSYRSAFRNAEKTIVIVASYFLPGNRIRRLIRKAAKRGVKIKVMLPQHYDVAFIEGATRYLYNWLLRNKVEIYEWHHSMLHGKLAMVDDQWMTIGSYNLNHLSDYASIELNVDIVCNDFVKDVSKEIKEIMLRDCEYITEGRYVKSDSFRKRISNWFSYRLTKISISLVTLLKAEET